MSPPLVFLTGIMPLVEAEVAGPVLVWELSLRLTVLVVGLEADDERGDRIDAFAAPLSLVSFNVDFCMSL